MSGHLDKVSYGEFTKNDGGKLIISSSADKTLRVWSPKKQECIRTISKTHPQVKWHEAPINCFAQHHSQPLIFSGDLAGEVCLSNYMTGQIISKMISPHDGSVESIIFCEDE